MLSKSATRPRLVGSFIRQRREEAKLSQRALGMLFSPPVTTQFISNLERGVTPLPLNHVVVLTRALGIEETELLSLLEKEYTLKLSGRLSQIDGAHGFSPSTVTHTSISRDEVAVAHEDLEFIRLLYDGYRRADGKTRQIFHNLCETVLPIRK
jgi:transcriptional regulator with XRE-family HTH domain